MIIEWKEYFDNTCKGEDMWGHYKTPNGSIFVVVDGASNHDGSMTGADVARLVHDRLKQESANLHHSSDLKDLMYSINTESTRVNEGAYAAIAGVLHRGNNLYAFGAGDVSIIAKKANGKLLQVLPLDLNMSMEEAEQRAKAEIGQTVNNIKITEKNGKVVTIKEVDDIDEIMLISRKGIIIRINSKDISTIGRSTQGVRVMRLASDDVVVAAAKVPSEQ